MSADPQALLLSSMIEVLRPVVADVVEQELQAREQERRWLTAEQAGELLGISAAAVGARVRKGKLPGRLYCRRIYVERAGLDAAIDESATFSAFSLAANPTKHKRGRAGR